MQGRRAHARCVIPASAEGILSLSRDVRVEAADGVHVTVISREPGVPGERGHLTATGANAASIPVRVSASRLAIVGGSVRHVLELAVLLNQAPDAHREC
jgi:hypothetical protein